MKTKEEILDYYHLNHDENVLSSMNEYAIEVLNDADNYLRQIMIDEAYLRDLTKEEGAEAWDNTIWHKTIANKISELKEDKQSNLKP